jgi:O-antigen ligase
VRGLRDRQVPLPVIAYVSLLALTFTAVDRHPSLTLSKAGFALASLATGWLASQVRWRRDELAPTLLLLAYLPVISVLIGVVLAAAGIHPLHMAEYTGVQRLQGASIPAYFGFLAAAGVAGGTALVLLAPAGPTATRRQAPWAALAILLGIACAGLSGTRGALIATIVIAAPAAVRLVRTARRGARTRRALLLGLLAVAGLMAVLPTLVERTKTSSTNDDLDTSGRAEAWSFYLDSMDGAVVGGRGIGAGPVIGEESYGLLRGDFRGTHNEYVRLFVEAGWVGVVLVVGAIAVHLAAHLARTPSRAKAGFIALTVTFAAYSIVDNTVSTFHFFLPFGLLVGIYSSPAARWDGTARW